MQLKKVQVYLYQKRLMRTTTALPPPPPKKNYARSVSPQKSMLRGEKNIIPTCTNVLEKERKKEGFLVHERAKTNLACMQSPTPYSHLKSQNGPPLITRILARHLFIYLFTYFSTSTVFAFSLLSSCIILQKKKH